MSRDEDAHRVSSELKAAHPEVPWREVIATRNVVAHGYDLVKLDVVWRVIEDDLPSLRAQLQAIVSELK